MYLCMINEYWRPVLPLCPPMSSSLYKSYVKYDATMDVLCYCYDIFRNGIYWDSTYCGEVRKLS